VSMVMWGAQEVDASMPAHFSAIGAQDVSGQFPASESAHTIRHECAAMAKSRLSARQITAVTLA